ncbi:hypothetical protein DFJ73DRAFT_768027 [Zopfochytrium polystomum]|nr:hypothetical protein DFJ73DRAFT_768027 [Zopfochytrium polystomum]
MFPSSNSTCTIIHPAQPVRPERRDGLKTFVASRNATYDVGLIASRDNTVSLHSLSTDLSTGSKNVVVDIFRVENGLIAEHWDIVQSYVATTASGNPMADPSAERLSFQNCSCGEAVEAANRALAVTALTQLFTNASAVPGDYLQDPYIQHNPQAQNGIAGFEAFLAYSGLATERASDLSRRNAILCLCTRASRLQGQPTYIVLDIFRAKNGKLVEHWDVIQRETPAIQTASGNAMFDASEGTLISPVDRAAYGPVGSTRMGPPDS